MASSVSGWWVRLFFSSLTSGKAITPWWYCSTLVLVMVHCLMLPRHSQEAGSCLNIKTVFPRYGDSHVKDKTVSETILSLTWESLYWIDGIFNWDGPQLAMNVKIIEALIKQPLSNKLWCLSLAQIHDLTLIYGTFAVEFRAMMNNYIPHKTVDMITHPYLNLT